MYSVACQLQKVLAIEYSQRAAYLLAYCIALKENLFALYKTVMVLAHPHCLNVNSNLGHVPSLLNQCQHATL